VKADCELYRREMAALRRGEETALPEADLRAHLETCADCRRAEEDVPRLFALLDQFQPLPAPDGLERLKLRVVAERCRASAAPAGRGRAIPLPVAVAAAAAAFLAALWLGSLIDWDGKTEAGRPAAVITWLDGEARVPEVEGVRGVRPRAGQGLAPGTVLVLGPTGRARLVFERGAQVELAPGSVVRVEADDALRLENGRLLASVSKRAAPFRVRTADAEVTTLGTRFIVEVRKGSTRVTVIEGRVNFSSNGVRPDQGVQVAAGKVSTVLAGRAPAAPTAARPQDLAWLLAPARPRLELELVPARTEVRSGEGLAARLRLVNRSGRAVQVDGARRAVSSYFLRVEDAAGGRSHFWPTVLAARVDGESSRAAVVQLAAGGVYELDLHLGSFAERPGEYRLTAIYFESSKAPSGWLGVVESRARKIVIKAPPARKRGTGRGREMPRN